MSGCPRCGGNYHPYHEVEREDVVTGDMRLCQMLQNWGKRNGLL
jgi:predicted  nucleic acid-binding Zn-ribbon protein